MEIRLKINDVLGQDERRRHILRVNAEDLRQCLLENPDWLLQAVVKEWLMKKPKRLAELLTPELRNTIYMQEKAAREKAQDDRRQRMHNEQELRAKREEVKRQRQNEQFGKSKAYRRSIDFYRDILGIEDST